MPLINKTADTDLGRRVMSAVIGAQPLATKLVIQT